MAAAFSATDGVRSGIALVSADGELVRELDFAPDRGVCCLSWSPDGKRLAYTAGTAIYVIDVDGSGRRRVSSGDAFRSDAQPSWSPSGELIAFTRTVNGNASGWLVAPDGNGVRQFTDIDIDSRLEWAPDGRRLLWAGAPANEPHGLFIYDVVAGTTTRLSRVFGFDSDPVWSPDGSQMAFSNEGIWVADAGGKGRRRITKTPAAEPRWSPDAREIVFVGWRPTDLPSRTGPISRQDVYSVSLADLTERRLTGPLGEGELDLVGDGLSPSLSPGGSRIFFFSHLPDYERSSTYVMNADGSCEQRFGPPSLRLLELAWRPGSSPQLPPLRCADLRVHTYSPRWAGVGAPTWFSVNVENDGNLAARNLTVTWRLEGPARLRPARHEDCRLVSSHSCQLPPLEPGRQAYLSLELSSRRPGYERIRLSVAADEADPDPTAQTSTRLLTVLPCNLIGSDGDDTLFGGKDNDRICGVGGRDWIGPGDGDDYVDGGTYADIINGGPGRDELVGGGGPDVVLADDGERDTIRCGSGNDAVVADPIDRVDSECERVARHSGLPTP